MPKVDRLFSLLPTIFDLLLDALRFIRLSLQPRCTLAAENLFLRKQLALYLKRHVGPRRPRAADPGNAFQTLSLATGSYYRQAGHIHRLASARLSTVLEAEIAAPRAASYPCRTPETDNGNG